MQTLPPQGHPYTTHNEPNQSQPKPSQPTLKHFRIRRGLTSLELPLRPSYCFFDFGSSRLHGLPMRTWLWQSYVACRSSCYTFDYEHEDSVVYIHSMHGIILRRRQQLANAVCMEAFLRPTQEAVWGCPANPWNCPANPQCGPANPWGEPLGLSGEPLRLSGEPLRLSGEPLGLSGERGVVRRTPGPSASTFDRV